MKSLTAKTCTKCKKRKGINDFYKNTRKNKNGENRYYISSWCKKCANEQKKKSQNKIIENGLTYGANHKKIKRTENANDLASCIISRLGNYRKRSIEPCDLTTEYLVNLFNAQNGLCYYTGIELDYARMKKEYIHEKAMSLDKLDPTKGYIKGNVVWCLNAINTMKFTRTETEFYELMKNILEINKKRLPLIIPEDSLKPKIIIPKEMIVITGTEGRPKGAFHPLAKITEEEAIDIKTSTKNIKELILKYGLEKSTIYKIRNGTLWSYLNEKINPTSSE